MAKAYVESTDLKWPMVMDSNRQLYRAYGFERADWWSIYGPASIWHYIKLLWGGEKLKKPGSDFRQLGGDVIIDPQGVIRFYHASESPHDRPDPVQLLDAIKRHQAG